VVTNGKIYKREYCILSMVQKGTKIIATLLLSLAVTTTVSYKSILHNVMSHHPTHMTTSDIVKNLPKMMFTRGFYDGVKDGTNCVPTGTDLNAIYLGKQENPLPLAKYCPTSATIPEGKPVYDPSCLVDLNFGPKSLEDTSITMLQRIRNMKKGEIIPLKESGSQYNRYYWDYGERLIDMQDIGPVEGFGNFTLSIGYDEQGRYLSLYDVFDFEIGSGGFMDVNMSLEKKVASAVLPNVGEPIYLYKRWYFEDVGISNKLLNEVWNQRITGEDSWFTNSPTYKKN
jgi:hypothetical protein